MTLQSPDRRQRNAAPRGDGVPYLAVKHWGWERYFYGDRQNGQDFGFAAPDGGHKVTARALRFWRICHNLNLALPANPHRPHPGGRMHPHRSRKYPYDYRP